jgi:hypothetical protein
LKNKQARRLIFPRLTDDVAALSCYFPPRREMEWVTPAAMMELCREIHVPGHASLRQSFHVSPPTVHPLGWIWDNRRSQQENDFT